MPRHCSAAGCKSRDTRETRRAGITFHRLPKRGKPRRTLWILNSRRTGPQGKGQWDPQSQFIYFCSKHFTPESFELSGVSGYRRLKEDALPTVFETLPRQRRTAAERAQRGASKQACAKRRTRRQSNSLKQEKEEPDPQTGAGPNVGGGAVVQDTEKTEEAGWEEDDLKSEGAAKTLERTLPPAASPPPSSLPHPSPGLSHVPPASLAPPSPRPPSGPPPPPSETASSVPASTAAVPSPSSSSSPPPPSPPPSETPSAPPARPPSPSRYMRRLPPPPGFYLPREHSYAQLCPLVWKKRYDKALDSLEKSVRLLNAARRREARLRQTLLWLRETRVRHGFREGGGGRGRPAPGPGPAERGARQGAEPRESEAERSKEDLGLLEAGPGETGEWGDWAPPPPTKAGPGEDPGFCFYCGRGRGDGEGWDIPGKERPRGRPRKPWEGERDEEEEEEVDEEEEEEDDETGGETGAEECCYYYYCEDGEGGASGREAGLHLVTVEQAVPKPPGDPAAPGGPPQPAEPLLHAALQLQVLQPMQPTQPTQLLQRGAAAPQCSLLAAAEGGDGAEQRLFWVQEGVEGRLVLLPVAAEEDGGGGAGRTGAEATAAEATVAAVAGAQAFQRLVVSAAGFQKAVADEGERRGLEGGGGVPRTKGRGENLAETRAVAGSSDVRERLKEHLEGFQLQLSNEFIH